MILAWEHAKFLLFVVIRKVFSAVQGILWIVNGTYLSIYTSRSESNYHFSAQVLDIIYSHKLDLLIQPASSGNFITTHNGFVSPLYALRDNVTLYCVTATEAVFVESPEDVDVTHSDHGAFLRQSQFQHARRLIKMPLAAFHKLAEEIGDPRGTIIFLPNTSRCGSTLLTQIFEKTGCCIGFSEPDVYNTIARSFGKMPQDQKDHIIRSCVRVQCKPLKHKTISAYLLKIYAPSITAIPELSRVFPESKLLFMYRDGLNVAQSLFRASTQSPMMATTRVIIKLYPRLIERDVERKSIYPPNFKANFPNFFVLAIYMWAAMCWKYMQMREDGLPISAVKYEDLVQHPRESISAILQYCDLPEELVDRAMTALNKDSQMSSPLSMNNMRKAKKVKLEGKDQDHSDYICDQMGLPRIPEPCNLAGTITGYKGSIVNGAQ